MGSEEGVCLWLTGRSGAGKTTVTNELVPMLHERGRVVTVLDVVPPLAKHWAERTSEGKLLRKAFVAREVARHGGITICVTVSARADVRAKAKSLVGPERFVEVYFDTPSAVSADRKAARPKRTPAIKRVRRLIRRWRSRASSGSSYEPPAAPDLVLDTSVTSPLESAALVLEVLEARGYLAPRAATADDGATASDEARSPTLDREDPAG